MFSMTGKKHYSNNLVTHRVSVCVMFSWYGFAVTHVTLRCDKRGPIRSGRANKKAMLPTSIRI